MIYMNKGLTIRSFMANDISQIVSLDYHYFFKHLSGNIYKYNLRYYYYMTRLCNKNNLCLVAVSNNELIGFVFLHKYDHNELINTLKKYHFKVMSNILKRVFIEKKYLSKVLWRCIFSIKRLLLNGKINNTNKYAHYYHIDPIVVKKDYWGTNVATYLLSEAENRLLAMNERKLILHVRAENKRAINFYKKMNFKVANNVIDNDNSKIIMEKMIVDDGLSITY